MRGGDGETSRDGVRARARGDVRARVGEGAPTRRTQSGREDVQGELYARDGGDASEIGRDARRGGRVDRGGDGGDGRDRRAVRGGVGETRSTSRGGGEKRTRHAAPASKAGRHPDETRTDAVRTAVRGIVRRGATQVGGDASVFRRVQRRGGDVDDCAKGNLAAQLAAVAGGGGYRHGGGSRGARGESARDSGRRAREP